MIKLSDVKVRSQYRTWVRHQPLGANATAPLARGGLAVGARVPDSGPPVQAVAGASGARDPPRWDVRRHRHRPGRWSAARRGRWREEHGTIRVRYDDGGEQVLRILAVGDDGLRIAAD